MIGICKRTSDGSAVYVTLESKTDSLVRCVMYGISPRIAYKRAYKEYFRLMAIRMDTDLQHGPAPQPTSCVDCGVGATLKDCAMYHPIAGHDPDPIIIEPPIDEEDTQPTNPPDISDRSEHQPAPAVDLNLMLKRPVIAPAETLEQSAELHSDFLEMAYRRYLQTPDQYFRVSQWYSGAGARTVHSHKVVAEKLAGHGLLDRHIANNGSRSKYRISQRGIAYVEAALSRWLVSRTHDAAIWLPKFESYTASLLVDGWYILPEPGRSWTFEQAFVNDKGQRSLHRIRNFGYPHGHGWDQHQGSYFYTLPDESGDYVESFAFQVFRQERAVSLEIPF